MNMEIPLQADMQENRKRLRPALAGLVFKNGREAEFEID
jgi:hypothetical protein